jgi:hypothetical protein
VGPVGGDLPTLGDEGLIAIGSQPGSIDSLQNTERTFLRFLFMATCSLHIQVKCVQGCLPVFSYRLRLVDA